MLELNRETLEDIKNALTTIIEFNKIINSFEISLYSLNHPTLRKSSFIGDEIITKEVCASILESTVNLISKGVLTDGELIYNDICSNCPDDVLRELEFDYLDTLSAEECDKVYDPDMGFMDASGYIEYLSNVGIKYMTFSVPFATELNEYTEDFLSCIPYLLQHQYEISDCLFLAREICFEKSLGHIQVNVYYLDTCISDFMADEPVDSIYGSIKSFIENEALRRG